MSKRSQKERTEQLEVIILEDWSDMDEWNSKSKSIQKGFEYGEEVKNTSLCILDNFMRIVLVKIQI